MKTLIKTGIFSAIILISCSQNDKVQSSEPADYAETKETMIKVRAGGSDTTNSEVVKDSLSVPPAMPPQSNAADVQ